MAESRHSHGHHHGHDHGSGHNHSHAPKDFGLAFAVGTGLNLLFVVVEAVYGILANSMALLADTGPNLSDVFALLVAWAASSLMRRAPTPRYTYGLRSSSILAALVNAVILLLAVGAIAVEAIQRFGNPQPIAGVTVMAVAGVGILINGATAWMFARGRHKDINVRGAYLHMAADAGVSLGVVLAGLAIVATGWLWLDPLASLVIAAIIVWGTWGLLRDSVNMALHAVPPGIDPGEVRSALEQVPGVASIHDLHIWPMSTTETALTCHLVMPQGCPSDAFLATVTKSLHDKFGIAHATLQVEKGDNECALEPDHVV
jgi:cobalt-zinc-cadmium efflux system protein